MARNVNQDKITGDPYSYIRSLHMTSSKDWIHIKGVMESKSSAEKMPPLLRWQEYKQHYTEALQPYVRKGSFDRNVSASDNTNVTRLLRLILPCSCYSPMQEDALILHCLSMKEFMGSNPSWHIIEIAFNSKQQDTFGDLSLCFLRTAKQLRERYVLYLNPIFDDSAIMEQFIHESPCFTLNKSSWTSLRKKFKISKNASRVLEASIKSFYERDRK